MPIPAELKPLIAQVRQQHPQLKDAPDEMVAQLILQAMAAQEGAAMPQNPEEADLGKMSAEECGEYGERLMNTGQWQAAERFFFAVLEKGEQANDLGHQCRATGSLGRLCLERGDFPQAMTLFQQALGLAERRGDRRMMGVI